MLPTDEEIQNLIKTGDVFRYAIVGFSAIELALEVLIEEALLTSHRVELKRLTAEFKVDLSIGLGLLGRDSKGLLSKLSKIRNFYAHEFKAGTEYCQPEELKSCFSKVHRNIVGDYFDKAVDFQEALRIAFIAVYYELADAISRQQAKKKHHADALLEIEAVLAVTEQPSKRLGQNQNFLKEMEKLRKKVEEKKQEIQSKRK